MSRKQRLYDECKLIHSQTVNLIETVKINKIAAKTDSICADCRRRRRIWHAKWRNRNYFPFFVWSEWRCSFFHSLCWNSNRLIIKSNFRRIIEFRLMLKRQLTVRKVYKKWHVYMWMHTMWHCHQRNSFPSNCCWVMQIVWRCFRVRHGSLSRRGRFMCFVHNLKLDQIQTVVKQTCNANICFLIKSHTDPLCDILHAKFRHIFTDTWRAARILAPNNPLHQLYSFPYKNTTAVNGFESLFFFSRNFSLGQRPNSVDFVFVSSFCSICVHMYMNECTRHKLFVLKFNRDLIQFHS